MISNLLLAGAAALVQPQLAEAPYTHPHVKQVVCFFANGMMGRGTAWRLSRGRFASVSHVTGRGGICSIDGKPITVDYDDPFGDFSLLHVEDDVDGGIPVNCNGFYHGYAYYSIGYARGDTQSVVITVRANKFMLPMFNRPGWQVFSGIEHVIPGMSGGVILNGKGEAVGSVNAYNPKGLSWSRPLSQTILCEKQWG